MAKKKKVWTTVSAADIAGIHCVAHSVLGITGIHSSDLEDIRQELALQLVREVSRFDPKISSWATFRGTILRQRVRQIIRDRVRPCARFRRPAALSLDEMCPCGESGETPPMTMRDLINEDGVFADGTEKAEIFHLGLQIDVIEFLEKLPKDLRAVCLSLQRRNVTETARYLKLSPRSIHRRIGVIRKLMIEAGLDIYVYPQNVAL